MSLSELVEGGIKDDLAAEIVSHLLDSLVVKVVEALAIQWKPWIDSPPANRSPLAL